MLEKPDALNLLRAASNTLIGDVLDSVSEDKRLATLMVAKAMAIAMREIEDPVEKRVAAELEQLQRLYPGEKWNGVEASVSLPQRIVSDLRSGTLDSQQRAYLRSHLLQMTRARLQVSNPKLLRALEALQGAS